MEEFNEEFIETRGRPRRRGRGRPVKDFLKKKDTRVTIRIDGDLYSKLYYLKGVTGKRSPELFREGIEELFDKQIKGS